VAMLGRSNEIWQVSPTADGYLLIVASRLDRRIPVLRRVVRPWPAHVDAGPFAFLHLPKNRRNRSFPETPRLE
jgi:hypothetical protein